METPPEPPLADGDALKEAVTLCTAVSDGNIKAVELLLDNGIDPNVWDYDMRAPVHIAAVEGQQRTLEVLLAHGANPNIADRCVRGLLDGYL